MTGPVVSVIVPNYNHSQFLTERIESILCQTYRDYELIILDDASTDDSVCLIKELLKGSEYQLIVNGQNSGSPFRQWSKGLCMASGQFVWIAESDDTAQSTFLERMLSVIDDKVDLAYCRAVNIDTCSNVISDEFWADAIDGAVWRSPFRMKAAKYCASYMTMRNVIPNASMVVFRNPQYDFIKGSIGLKYAGDWLAWSRFLDNSKGDVVFLPECLTAFRHHGSTSRSNLKKNQASDRISEYCLTLSQISNHYVVGGLNVFMVGLRGAWDWMYRDLFYQYRIGSIDSFATLNQALSGVVRWCLPFRLLASPRLLSSFLRALCRSSGRI